MLLNMKSNTGRSFVVVPHSLNNIISNTVHKHCVKKVCQLNHNKIGTLVLSLSF